MKLFMFNSVENLTNEFHSEGGLVVIAENLERAVQITKEYLDPSPIKLSDEEIKHVLVFETPEEDEEKIYIFPNSGCC